MTRTAGCACGHAREFHAHYHRGTDCSVDGCGCRRFCRAGWWEWWHGFALACVIAAGLSTVGYVAVQVAQGVFR